MRTDTERLDWILAALDSGNGEPLERLQAAYTLELRGRVAMDAAMGAKVVEPGEPMPELTALDLAVAEVGRIRNVKGFSEERDDAEIPGTLVLKAVQYLMGGSVDSGGRNDESEDDFLLFWPDEPSLFKPSPDDRKRELTKGIALALCELDRLIRAERRATIERTDAAYVHPSEHPEVAAPREFKVGDRVRVIGRSESQDVKVGALGTVREAGSSCPWIEFDEPTGYPAAIPLFGIPAGYGDIVRLRDLEHVDG